MWRNTLIMELFLVFVFFCKLYLLEREYVVGRDGARGRENLRQTQGWPWSPTELSPMTLSSRPEPKPRLGCPIDCVTQTPHRYGTVKKTFVKLLSSTLQKSCAQYLLHVLSQGTWGSAGAVGWVKVTALSFGGWNLLCVFLWCGWGQTV